MAGETLYKLAYDEAVRSLLDQQTAIESVRSRAGLVFSAAAISTSFLGAQALRSGTTNFIPWLALVGFVGMAIALLAILWPRRWDLAIDPHEVIRAYVEAATPAPIEDLHRDLSFHMHRAYLENQAGLEKLFVFLQVANALFVVELVIWIVAVAHAS